MAIGETQFATEELLGAEHRCLDMYLTIDDVQTKFKETGDDVLFDLSCHSRLLAPHHCRCVRVCVKGEGTVFGRGLVGSDTLLHGGIVGFEAGNGGCVSMGVKGGLDILADSNKEFADHVPIDATQSLVFVERTGTTCEGVVVEHTLIEVKQLLPFFRTDGLLRSVDSTGKEVGIVETCIEVHPTLTILNEDVCGMVS